MDGPAEPTYCLGVDVGGTFTDIVLSDRHGRLHCVKVASTPVSPGASTLHGVDLLRRTVPSADVALAGLAHTHSSTVATNALIERTGARVGMLVTKGFRDLLELQRLALPHPMRFDSRRPEPIVRRRDVREVAERVGADGTVHVALDRVGLLDAGAELLSTGVEIVVVCFVHSYLHPGHERLAREELERAFPGMRVDLSCEVWPQAREYERATLAALNAYVRPTVEGQVARLVDGLAERGVRTPARVARSNGGAELATTLLERPAAAVLSGPAAGVAGAALTAERAGLGGCDLVTFDVGGTSADIGVIRAGRPVLSSEESIGGLPLLLPTVAVSAIGAGGGSVIWLDDAGSLRVGPRSVGADPGPASYGLGNTDTPALTDAFVLTGLLDAGQLLGESIRLLAEPARLAVGGIADRLGWTPDQVADGAIRIVTAAMAANLTKVLARRVLDAAELTMVAYGGAGPLVAALVAEECGVARVLVPTLPGALCALGATFGDIEGDLVEPVYRMTHQLAAGELAAVLEQLTTRTDEWLDHQSERIPIHGKEIALNADMRFDGQGYDLTVLMRPEWLRAGDVPAIAEAFRVAHTEMFGHANPAAHIWLNELRAHVVGRTAKPQGDLTAVTGTDRQCAAARRILRDGKEFTATVLPRSAVTGSVGGPAILTQMDTTTFVPPGWTAAVIESGALLLSRTEGGPR